VIVKFYNRCLEGLDGLLGFEGAISRVDKADLGPPPLVFNVTDLARAGIGFYCQGLLNQDTAGAGVQVFAASGLNATLFASDARFNANLAAGNLNFDELDFWLLGVSCTASAATAANLANVSAGVEERNNTTEPIFLTIFQDAVTALTAAGRTCLLPSSGDRLLYPVKLPLKLSRDSRLLAAFTDDAGGVLSANVTFHLWAAPRGTFPPLA